MEALLDCNVQMFISMDSPDPERLSAIRRRAKYGKIVANIERLASQESRPFLVFTLQEENFDDIVPMARFSAERELHFLLNVVRRDEGIAVFREKVNSRLDALRLALAEVTQLYRDRAVRCFLPDRVQGFEVGSQESQKTYGGRTRCPAIERELCVLFDGTVTPCNMFNPYVYGNIAGSSLASIRAGAPFQWFAENHKEHPYCSNCACLGGTA